MGTGTFLGLDATGEDAAAVVLPVPLEATVSYERGTAHGPRAILAASEQVELYDREFDAEPALLHGIRTLPELVLPPDLGEAVERIADAVAAIAARSRLPVVLGGEHTVTVGVVRGLLRAHEGPLTIVQVDAHADLRDTYDGTPLSHACAARRWLDDPRVEQVLQVGLRSESAEDAAFARSQPERVHAFPVEELRGSEWQQRLATRLAGRNVHLTLDVDGLDPSVVPATGTPEPGGLTWWQALEVIRITARASARVVAVDCVELAPREGQHAADFTVAKLVYKAISHALAA